MWAGTIPKEWLRWEKLAGARGTELPCGAWAEEQGMNHSAAFPWNPFPAAILSALGASAKPVCSWFAWVSPEKDKKGLVLLSLCSSVVYSWGHQEGFLRFVSTGNQIQTWANHSIQLGISVSWLLNSSNGNAGKIILHNLRALKISPVSIIPTPECATVAWKSQHKS